ncbi:MAG: hypothetical protein LAT57_02260 [Balneolales bacterium]|nr:hypothetical protein [Balneolales bacterium]
MKHLFFILIALSMLVFAQAPDAYAQNQQLTEITSWGELIKPAFTSDPHSQDRLKLLPSSGVVQSRSVVLLK